MARGHIQLQVQPCLEECDPDGSDCIMCEDAVYLGAFWLRVALPGYPGEPYIPGQLCSSCAEVIRDSIAEQGGT